ncbi:EAL domain-containing protein [Eionea flava]
MNLPSSSFRLIIVHDSPQEAQRLSSMLHNAGNPCRAQHINTEDTLIKALEDQNWDLLITYDDAKSLSPAIIIRHIRKFERDIPVILLTNESSNKSVVDGMKLGAADVAQIDDDQHLLLIINRELENRRQRKLTRVTERKLKEIERKNQRLLDSSREGIAFVQDGMYLYANDSYAEMLGFNGRDDIEFMPIMDTIKEDEHQHIKKTLKDFTLQVNEDNNTIKFTALLPDGQEKSITADLLLGEYEEEACTQLICHTQVENSVLMEAELQNIKYTDALTGLYNRTALIEEIEKTVDIVTQEEIQQSFILIDVDRFSKKVKNVLSITDADKLLKNIAVFIKKHYDGENFIARVSDHTFAVISDEHDAEKLIKNAEILCQEITEHFFEVDNKSLQFTLSVGICLINEATKSSQTLIHHALKSIEELRKSQDGNGALLFQKKTSEDGLLASTIKKALTNNDLSLLFQPIISLRGEEIERYEILLRMNIDGEELSPPKFLATAEELGLSNKIDRWVILESIKHLQRATNNTQHFINLTASTLQDNGLLNWVKVALDAAKVQPSSIVFQVKEADVIQQITVTKQFTEAAKKLGIEFSITNFGSAAIEPLTTLEHIDNQHIKIDGALAKELQDNPENSKDLEELVQALHEKGKVTTIPHIEKASILSKLWQLGVHNIQGNYLQAPTNEMNYEFSSED